MGIQQHQRNIKRYLQDQSFNKLENIKYLKFPFISLYDIIFLLQIDKLFLTAIFMSEIKSELSALREKHEYTVMELADLKQDYLKLKQINNTIIENLVNKQPSETLQQIKLIVDGTFHSQKIIDLEAEIDRLNQFMNEEVEKRVKAITDQLSLAKKCDKCGGIQKQLSKIKETLDQKVFELEEVKADFDIMVSKRKSTEEKCQYLKKANEKLEESHKIKEKKMKTMIDLEQVHKSLEKLDEQWQKRYDSLAQQYDSVVIELENLYWSKESNTKKGKKENQMVKTIQNLVGEISLKKNQKLGQVATSRLTLDSDCTEFSIKDAINRPRQFPYY